MAFAASLLPARFLADEGRALGVTRIVVVVPGHERSYGFVAERLDGASVERLRGGRVRRTIALAGELIRARFTSRQVLFFHESSWPEFDLLVALIRPAGAFLPQVSMEPGFEKVTRADLPWPRGPRGVLKRAAFALAGRNFAVYRSPRLSGDPGYDYFFSYRQYPSSIRAFPPPVRARRDPPPGRANAILFIVGKESVRDEYLRDVYSDLARTALDAGFDVVIKDHPVFALNIGCPGCEELDAAFPIELLDRPFALTIGIASTALANVAGTRISIVDALDQMPPAVKQMRREYLDSLGGDPICRVASLEELRRLIRAAAAAGGLHAR